MCRQCVAQPVQLPMSTADKDPKPAVVLVVSGTEILVEGRKVAVFAQDFTVFGGSLSGPTSDRSPQAEGTFSWFGIDGTWFWADSKNKLGFVGMIQRRGNGGPGAVNFQLDSAQAVYKALAK